VDVEKMTLAFVNLLNNAIRFSPEGSAIVIGAVKEQKEATIWVKDHGIGITDDKLQKIFFEPCCTAAIKLLLRRTPVRFILCSAKFRTLK
jgi:K+-sensing histidine kinase KdpD